MVCLLSVLCVTESRRASVATVTSNRSTVAASSARGSLARTNTLPSRPSSAPKTTAKDSRNSNKSEFAHVQSALRFVWSELVKSVFDNVIDG